MQSKNLWRTAYRHARLMNYGTLHTSFSRRLATLAKDAAEFCRGIHPGHRDFTPPRSSLHYRLHLKKLTA